MNIRCPGCHTSVSILGDLIERHHAPGWESVETYEHPLSYDAEMGAPRVEPITIERRLECGYSGARVRVKR